MSVYRDETFNSIFALKGLSAQGVVYRSSDSVPPALVGNNGVWVNSSSQPIFTNSGGVSVNLLNPNSPQVISPAGGVILPSSTLVLIDNTSGPVPASLAAGSVGDTKTVRILYTRGATATISTPTGSIWMSPARPIVNLYYSSNGWIVLDATDGMYASNLSGPPTNAIGEIGSGQFGRAISFSSDGKTMAVGSPGETNSPPSVFTGAVYIYTRSSNFGSWVQQSRLVGNNIVGTSAFQGVSVALSADGNTLAVGGSTDNAGVGAVWVWTRPSSSTNTWSQQKLTPSTPLGASNVGGSVSISADGNTIVAGGSADNGNIGAVWVWTRTSGIWSVSTKLIGTGSIGSSNQGASVSLSSNGMMIASGGPADNANVGAVWMWILQNGVWTQISKLVAGGGTFGYSVVLSSDGLTLVAGAPSGNAGVGQTYIYYFNSGTWTQNPDILSPPDAIGPAAFGSYVAISSDGRIAYISGPSDNASSGALWVYAYDGGVWRQIVNKITGAGSFGFAMGTSSNGSILGIGSPSANANVGNISIYV